jgi:dethiobiotin synthetase
MNYFVTAIGTDSGKTLVSAILCTALGADYWKPVQAGHPTDSDTIRELTAGSDIKVHPERYVLQMPASPHAAAAAEGIAIALADFKLPATNQSLVIEGAGGALVPLNEKDFVIDLASRFKAKIILVSNIYLGSINHTLLTWEALHKRGLETAGIVFNGESNAATEDIILRHTRLPCLLRVERERNITGNVIRKYAQKIELQP